MAQVGWGYWSGILGSYILDGGEREQYPNFNSTFCRKIKTEKPGFDHMYIRIYHPFSSDTQQFMKNITDSAEAQLLIFLAILTNSGEKTNNFSANRQFLYKFLGLYANFSGANIIFLAYCVPTSCHTHYH